MKLFYLAACALFLTISASNAALATEADSNWLFRIKSGRTYFFDNTIVSGGTPITGEAFYKGWANFGLGASAFTSAGSAGYTAQSDAGGVNAVILHDSRRFTGIGLIPAYFFEFGKARVQLGIFTGAVFFSESFSLSAGPTNTVLPSEVSTTLFAFGPSINLDLPITADVFATIGGDYLLNHKDTQYILGSLYVGLGMNW